MPKRRISPRRAAQIRVWRLAGNRARSFSHPYNTKVVPGSPSGYKPPGTGGRRHKQGGKAYTKKTASGVTVAPAVASILAGVKPKAGLKEFHPSTIRGDVTQSRGTPYRKRLKSKKVK